MKKLSLKVWECRCGHREINKALKEQEKEKEKQGIDISTKFYEKRASKKRKWATHSYKKVKVTRRKRTSLRGE